MQREEIIKRLIQNDSTVLSFPDRGPWGDSRYRGNCSGWYQAFLIWKYKVEKMAELFSGSGTGYDVCKDMGVSYVGADLNPNPVRPGILQVNAVTDEVPEEFLDADFLFMHPPYGAEIKIPYAGSMWQDPKREYSQYDLGQMNWDIFMKELNAIIMKYYAAMDTGARMGVMMGDVRRNGLHSMLTDIVKPGQLEQIIIKTQHNTMSERNNISYAHKNFVPLVHEYIMVLKKIMPYMIEFQLPVRKKLDIRDSMSATWRDVVFAVLTVLGGNATLEEIYAQVEQYAKCRNNPHWREKVRQVLQQYKCFINAARGTWALAA